jgi:hypothetical protein
VFTNDCTMLVVATGWWENTGQVWTDGSRQSVGNQWGTSPVKTEVVPFTLTLPVGAQNVQAWALDERGQRKSSLPVTGDASSATVTVSTNSASIWYEVQVSRWVASFDLWRMRYFTPDELASPGVSGEAAAPDGDRVANLWKYFLGLPGRTPASPERLPEGTVWTNGTDRFLAFVYDRDKLATDVACVGEVSSNLAAWNSGTGYTRIEQIVDAGPLLTITERDLTPVSSGASHYLRLRLQRLAP